MLRDVVLRVADDQLGQGQGGLGRHCAGVRAVCGSRRAEATLVTHIPHLIPVSGSGSSCVWPGPFSAKPRSSSLTKQQQL